MKKEQVARRLARETRTSTATAADQLDRIVSDLLLKVRRGQTVSLPGLGSFQAGTQKEFQFERGDKEREKPRKAKK